MLPGEREVAGLRCSEVLGALSGYLDGGLPDPVVQRMAAHVADCHVCERFGARFSAAVTALRATLREPEPLPPDIEARLRERLASR
jgi:anti-sigma factor RsiW